MTQPLSVSCLVDRFWEPSEMDWDGVLVPGTLIAISAQSAEDNAGKIIPVGIILLDDGTFECVPMEFVFERSGVA